MNENTITGQIVDAAYRVHTKLGPGLLESVYEAALAWELEKRGLSVTRQQGIPVVYENVHIHTGFFADLIVNDQIIVEIKSIDVIAPVHRRQLLTYLKMADKRLGLLINFNVALIKGRHHPDGEWAKGMISRRDCRGPQRKSNLPRP